MTSRWGTWLEAVLYYAEHFAEHTIIREDVNSIPNTNNAEIVKKAKKIVNTTPKMLKKDLAFIKSNFSFLVDSIEKMQSQGVDLTKSIRTMENVRLRLNAMKDKSYLKKLEEVLERNVGYETLSDIAHILDGDATHSVANEHIENLTPAQISSFKYCPVTSCDVERIFSKYEHILSERRRGFLFENFKHHLIVNCNSKECVIETEVDGAENNENESFVVDLDESAD